MNTWQDQLADAKTGLLRAIQDAAIRLIAQRGMPDVSMSAVAQEAGVSRQTLYNHYTDLEAIVIDAARSQIMIAGQMIGEAASVAPDAPSALDNFIRGTLMPATGGQMTVAGGGMSPEAEREVSEMLEPVHLQLQDLLKRGVAEGTFRSDLDPEGVSEVIFHMIGSGRRLIHMGRDPQHVADTIATLMGRAVSV